MGYIFTFSKTPLCMCLHKRHCAINIIRNAFLKLLFNIMFLSYSCGAVVNIFPTAAFSDDVCMYPFPSDRCLGCLWSLLSKTMLPRASSHLSPYGLCAKGGDAEPEGMSTLSILQLVLQMLHQLALPQPGLTGSHLPRPCQPLILSDFLILAKLLGKKKKMTSDHFNLRIADCY